MNNSLKKIIAISGVSGAGKGSVYSCLKNNLNVSFSVSYTTRPARKGEQNGLDYWFVSNKEFDEAIRNNEFLEWEEVHLDKYGTKRKDLEAILASGKIALMDIDYKGIGNLKKMYPNIVTIFITVPSVDVAIERLRGRGTESEDAIKRRIERYNEEMREEKNFDFVIVNDDLEKAQKELISIIDYIKN